MWTAASTSSSVPTSIAAAAATSSASSSSDNNTEWRPATAPTSDDALVEALLALHDIPSSALAVLSRLILEDAAPPTQGWDVTSLSTVSTFQEQSSCSSSDWSQSVHTFEEARDAAAPLPFLNPWPGVASSRRWQNLNVVLPILIPGANLVATTNGSNSYIFPDTQPSAQLLLSSAAPVCNIWASCLRLRIAVVHKCPEFAVPTIAALFLQVMRTLPKGKPLRLRAAGLLRHKIQLRSARSVTYRYDTICSMVDDEDAKVLANLINRLREFQAIVNGPLLQQLETSMRHQHHDDRRGSTTPACCLEFRFSPCRDLKMAIREGPQCNDPLIDGNVAGGGAASLTAWSRRFIAEEQLTALELRLETDKTPVLVQDPLFPDLLCREICVDPSGATARAVFAAQEHSVLPHVTVLRGCQTTVTAAKQYLGATGKKLNDMLIEAEKDEAAAFKMRFATCHHHEL